MSKLLLALACAEWVVWLIDNMVSADAATRRGEHATIIALLAIAAGVWRE